MRIAIVAVVVVAAVQLSADAEEARLRLENTSRDGGVRIVLADESVRSIEVNVPGVMSGETVIVEAPAPQVRLGGGSLTGDLLLEAIVSEKVRRTTPRPPTVFVLPASRHTVLEPRRYLNDVFTGVGLVYEPAFWAPYSPQVSRAHCVDRVRSSRGVRSVRPVPHVSRGTYTSRAMMPGR